MVKLNPINIFGVNKSLEYIFSTEQSGLALTFMHQILTTSMYFIVKSILFQSEQKIVDIIVMYN